MSRSFREFIFWCYYDSLCMITRESNHEWRVLLWRLLSISSIPPKKPRFWLSRPKRFIFIFRRVCAVSNHDWQQKMVIHNIISVLAKHETVDSMSLFFFFSHTCSHGFWAPSGPKERCILHQWSRLQIQRTIIALSRHQWRPTGDSSVNAGRHACRWSSVNLSFVTPATPSTF